MCMISSLLSSSLLKSQKSTLFCLNLKLFLDLRNPGYTVLFLLKMSAPKNAKLLLFYLLLFLYSSTLFFCASSDTSHQQIQTHQFGHRRISGDLQKEEQVEDQTKLLKPSLSNKNQTKSTKLSLSTKNQTKVAKFFNLSSKNQTKLTNSNLSTKNQSKEVIDKSSLTKLAKSSNSTKANPSLSKPELKKLNSTSKHNSPSTKTASDLSKQGSSNNKTTKSTAKKVSQAITFTDKKLNDPDLEKQTRIKKTTTSSIQKQKQPSWLDQEEERDLVSEFRDLPTKFQQTLLPDLERISITSKKYLTKANKDITKGFKPYVGNKHASTIATLVSFAFILIPLLLVSLIVNHFKAYFSLQKILIFIQVYLAIYFSILCISSLLTGLDPLKFFYATSQSTYVCVMVMQTLCYLLYLLLLVMFLIVVFATDCGLGSRVLGLGQTFVGIAVGLHYYVAVFHRVVMHQQPKTNWKVHAVYATCFVGVCLFAKFERSKKAYLEEGGEEGKKN